MISRFRNVPKVKRPDNNQAAAQVQGKLEQAVALHQTGQLAQAQSLYEEILNTRPKHFKALHLSGVIALQTNNPARAIELIDKAIASNPRDADAYNNRGIALGYLKRYEEAVGSYERALKINPDYAEAHNNRGVALTELDRLEEALASHDRAIEIKPEYADAHSNRGIVLGDLKRYEEAVASYGRALSIKHDYAVAHNNCGVALKELNRFEAALASYEHAIEIKPDYAEAHNNRGIALQDLNRDDEALASYDRAIEIKFEYAEAHHNRGNVLRNLKRHDEAAKSYGRALHFKPNLGFLFGIWLHARMTVCDWTDYQANVSMLTDKIYLGERASPSFPVLAICGSLSLQRKAAEIQAREKSHFIHALPKIPTRRRHEKTRIGYFSADFHNHASAHLMAELFERHDRSKFELTAFSFGPHKSDEMRQRVAASFERFIDVRGQSDKDVALLSRSLEVDIAVDLKGFTDDSRSGIFALRAAPLQVNYLGYPGTMGAEYIDYLIADATLISDAEHRHYAEKIAYLPNSYQVNDRKRAIADKAFSREELGLPQTGFVFCCFNNSYKITPGTFDGWMRILKQVKESVLWLLEDSTSAANNLRREALQRGINAERLIFAKRRPIAEYLSTYRVADLFVDTLPYNAHTTASDALWAGLPVLTCVGESFAGRVAASLLTAVQLPELITSAQADYEALAVELATDPHRLQQIRRKLQKNRLTTPLFDTTIFARHLENAYTQMYERYQSGLPPEHFHVVKD